MVDSDIEINRLRAYISSGLIFMVAMAVSVLSHAQATEDEELVLIASGIMVEVRYAGLTTVDSLGYPNTRTMDALPPTSDFEVWLATNPLSRKVRQIRNNSSVSLYYPQSEQGNYVTIVGKASIVNTPQAKAEHWREDWAEFYPSKEDMMLIKVEPIRIELVSYENGIISESIDWKAPEINLQKK